MNITHIKRAGLAGVISITAALSACGTPSATPDIDVQSDDMEEATDRAEDAANVLEGIVLKHS